MMTKTEVCNPLSDEVFSRIPVVKISNEEKLLLLPPQIFLHDRSEDID